MNPHYPKLVSILRSLPPDEWVEIETDDPPETAYGKIRQAMYRRGCHVQTHIRGDTLYVRLKEKENAQRGQDPDTSDRSTPTDR